MVLASVRPELFHSSQLRFHLAKNHASWDKIVVDDARILRVLRISKILSQLGGSDREERQQFRFIVRVTAIVFCADTGIAGMKKGPANGKRIVAVVSKIKNDSRTRSLTLIARLRDSLQEIRRREEIEKPERARTGTDRFVGETRARRERQVLQVVQKHAKTWLSFISTLVIRPPFLLTNAHMWSTASATALHRKVAAGYVECGLHSIID